MWNSNRMHASSTIKPRVIARVVRRWLPTTLIVAAAMVGAAWACGPFFPNQLLDHRDATLKATPQNSFAWEAAHLLIPTDTLKPHEAAASDDATPSASSEASSQGLTLLQWQRNKTLRLSADGDAAYASAVDLPEDLRLYIAGAVDVLSANAACAGDAGTIDAPAPAPAAGAGKLCEHPDPTKMDHAIARFEKVLALPADQAKVRGVWAAYMLGRIHAQRASAMASDAVGFARERNAATTAFQQSRLRAVAGASDPQGLAVSSFGEEARLKLYSGAQQCHWANLVADNDKCGEGIAPADLNHAITLYAAQAGHGSNSAVQSLASIASSVLRDEWPEAARSRAVAVIEAPVSQRLLVAYALARMGDEIAADASARSPAANPRSTAPARTGDQIAPDASAPSPAAKPDSTLSALVQAIQGQGLDRVAGADRLAALAYRQGRYDLAATLAARAPGPLASWVDAKLALHRGDLAAAARAYADAVQAFPKVDDPKVDGSRASVTPASQRLITGEQGVLSLARGEYVQAMSHLYEAAVASGGDGNIYDEDGSSYGYRNDLFYVAERVLTINELKAFVDAHVHASTPPPEHEKATVAGLAPPGDSLRWLLARRLMRSGRYDEAQAYFPASGDNRFGDVDLRAKAREYASDLHRADSAWTDIGKAEARYAAAVIARVNGMELLGYEQAPDYVDSGGSFQGGSGHLAADLKQAWVTDGERQRFATSAAKLDWRFHYRYIAADGAVAAADLLPPRSQAFAAVLCKATGWMRAGPPDYNDHYPSPGEPPPTQPSEAKRRVAVYYARYLKQGAYVSWTGNFGADCEAPDFNRAGQLLRHQRLVRVRHQLRRFLPVAMAVALAGIGAAGWWVIRRRRKPTLTA